MISFWIGRKSGELESAAKVSRADSVVVTNAPASLIRSMAMRRSDCVRDETASAMTCTSKPRCNKSKHVPCTQTCASMPQRRTDFTSGNSFAIRSETSCVNIENCVLLTGRIAGKALKPNSETVDPSPNNRDCRITWSGSGKRLQYLLDTVP